MKIKQQVVCWFFNLNLFIIFAFSQGFWNTINCLKAIIDVIFQFKTPLVFHFCKFSCNLKPQLFKIMFQVPENLPCEESWKFLANKRENLWKLILRQFLVFFFLLLLERLQNIILMELNRKLHFCLQIIVLIKQLIFPGKTTNFLDIFYPFIFSWINYLTCNEKSTTKKRSGKNEEKP